MAAWSFVVHGQLDTSTITLDVLHAPVSPASVLLGVAESEIQRPTGLTSFMVSLRQGTNDFSQLPKNYALDLVSLRFGSVDDGVMQFSRPQAGGRQDLADREQAELLVLQAYLPARLSAEEVAAEVRAIVAELGAQGPGDMGKVMAAVKARLAGKADMGAVSAAVKAALAG